MYNIGLVITAKAAGRDLIRQLAFRKVCLIESDDTEGVLQIVYNNIVQELPGRLLPLFHVIHLRFAKLSRRELYSQLRFLSAHPVLFTHMALVICEVDASLDITYANIAHLLEQKGQHRLNMDYFLVLSTKTTGEVYKVYSESEFLRKSAIDYFNHLGEPGQYLIPSTKPAFTPKEHEQR